MEGRIQEGGRLYPDYIQENSWSPAPDFKQVDMVAKSPLLPQTVYKILTKSTTYLLNSHKAAGFLMLYVIIFVYITKTLHHPHTLLYYTWIQCMIAVLSMECMHRL